MNHRKTESLCISSIVYHLLRTSAVGISYTNILFYGKENGYLSILIGFIFGFIPLLIYLYIMDSNPDLNIVQLNEKIFGKFFGKIINSILCVFIFLFTIITFWNLGDFVNSQFLNATPTFAITIAFLIPIIYIIHKGFNTISRTALILFYVNILAFLLIVFSLVPQIEINNLLPFMEEGIVPVLKGSYNFVAYNLLPLFLLTIIPKKNIINNNKTKKHIIIMYMLSSFAIILVMLMITGIFGINLAQTFAYPEYHVLKRISLFNSLQRLESMISLTWLFAFFITLSLSLYYVCENIKVTFNITNKKIITTIIVAISVIALILSEFIFKNHTQAQSFLLKVFPNLMLIFLLGIPIIIAIKTKFTKKTSNQTSTANIGTID